MKTIIKFGYDLSTIVVKDNCLLIEEYSSSSNEEIEKSVTFEFNNSDSIKIMIESLQQILLDTYKEYYKSSRFINPKDIE